MFTRNVSFTIYTITFHIPLSTDWMWIENILLRILFFLLLDWTWIHILHEITFIPCNQESSNKLVHWFIIYTESLNNINKMRTNSNYMTCYNLFQLIQFTRFFSLTPFFLFHLVRLGFNVYFASVYSESINSERIYSANVYSVLK